MARLKDANFFTLHGWMVNQMGLRGGELIAYALVYQFTQYEGGLYTGGVPYLADWMGCHIDTARRYLHALEGKGLIKSIAGRDNGVPFKNYQVVDSHIPEICKDTPENNKGISPNFTGEDPRNLQGGIPEIYGVNYKNNSKDNSKKTPKGGAGGSKFVIPTLEEVSDFIKEIDALVDPDEFYNYYQSQGWKVGKNPMKDWKAAVRQWNAKRKKENNDRQEPEKMNRNSKFSGGRL